MIQGTQHAEIVDLSVSSWSLSCSNALHRALCSSQHIETLHAASEELSYIKSSSVDLGGCKALLADW